MDITPIFVSVILAQGADPMVLASKAFGAGQRIPDQYTVQGQDVSPPLAWDQVPDGCQEFAIICNDPDAPSKEPWVHWIIYKIPADVRSLPAGVPAEPQLQNPAGALQGHNSWTSGRMIGYRGPAPPPKHGVHHYHFRLYALDAKLPLGPGADQAELKKAVQGHVLAEAELIGTFER